MHVASEGSDVQTCHVPSAITFEFVHEDRYVIYKQMNYLLNLECRLQDLLHSDPSTSLAFQLIYNLFYLIFHDFKHFVENAISFVSYAENEIDL